MTDVKELLDRALPTHPLTINITRESAVALGRRAHRRRRVSIATAVATLVCAVAGVGYAVVPVDRGPRTVGTASPSATPSASPVVTPPQSTIQRLSKELRAAAARVRPDATITDSRMMDGTPVRAPFEAFASQAGYKAFGEIRDSQGPGTMFVLLLDDGGSANCRAGRPNQTCDYRVGPHGEQVAILVTRGSATVPTTYAVEVAKPNGTWLFVELNNYSQTAQPMPSTKADAFRPHPQRALPPMTVDQLVDFALTEGLVL